MEAFLDVNGFNLDLSDEIIEDLVKKVVKNEISKDKLADIVRTAICPV